VKRIVISVLTLAVLGAAALFAFAPLRHWALVQVGRGDGCTAQRAWAITAEKQELTRVKDDILSKTKLLQKEPRGLELYQTPYGEFWAPEGSRYILPFNLAEEATHIYGTGDRFVKKGDVVLDCGANVGTFARFALDAGAKLVVAIEPAPDNLECLRRNFKKEIDEQRLVIYPKGVWNKEDTLELLVDPDNQAADSFVIHRQGAKAVAKVPLTTIDNLMNELKLDRVDYIKMDIEGAEVKALEGGKSTIAKFHPRMSLSVYHQDEHPVEVPKAARAAWSGYQTECGPCNALPGRVRPDIMYFY
jgi:FkbM family methyltransferase